MPNQAFKLLVEKSNYIKASLAVNSGRLAFIFAKKMIAKPAGLSYNNGVLDD